MKRSTRLFVLPAILLGAVPAWADEKPNYDAYFDEAVAPSIAPSPRSKAAAPDGFASSIDERRGVPTFIWAGSAQPLPPGALTGSIEGAARGYVSAYAHRWNLPASIGADLNVGHIHDTGRGGIIVTFRQRVNGVEVFRGEVKVLMARNLELVAISGAPRGGAGEAKGKGAAFQIAPNDAIASAMNDLYSVGFKSSDLSPMKKTVADYSYFDLAKTPKAQASGVRLTDPFRVKKVFFQLPNRLVAAYFLEIIASKGSGGVSDSFAYVIAADKGGVLFRQNLKAFEAFDYRVFADPDGRPTDGPIADLTPHPTGLPDNTPIPFIAPSLITMEGFNTNPLNQPDPWLSYFAVDTRGNNVDAYTDDNGPNGFSNGDLRATLTSPNTFDRVYDLNAEPQSSPGQMMAAVTQLFYLNNWLHDRFYDSGFDEAAGNAQNSNFNRGGIEGDVLHAEAQDGFQAGSRNNAFMSTPSDGASPQMAMFVWSALSDQSLTLLPGTVLESNTASWGLQNFDVTADAVIADDGTAVPSQACMPILNNVTGKIVVVDQGGGCLSSDKAANVTAHGGAGMIFISNTPGGGAPPLGNTPPGPVTIGGMSTSFEDGATLTAAIKAGPTQVHLYRLSGVEHDGTIDNGVAAHEWGHYLHHRLEQCGAHQCNGMSEGWADFNALQMIVRPGDNLDGTYALVLYAAESFTNSPAYFGLRRSPYTTDMNKNGFTFKHMADGEALPTQPIGYGGGSNSEVHNVGEIWAQMMFEGYISLLKESQGANPRYTFEEARRLMNDYVVAGMKLTPVEATVTQQRDGVLAATYANEPLDTDLFATGFAKRGLGTCAVSPPINTADMKGLVESFSNQGNFAVVSLDLDDSVASCDSDGVLDAEEIGKVTVTVMNTGLTTISGTTVDISTTNLAATFPNGAQITLPDMKPYSTAQATFDVQLDKNLAQIDLLDFKADVMNAAGCSPTQSFSRTFRANYDDVPNAANIDEVESNIIAWDRTEGYPNAPAGSDLWTRQSDANGNNVWFGLDYGTFSDSALESPTLNVSASDTLVISFNHRYSFEQDPGINWDGAVIEVSDGGGPWKDISAFVDPGYDGTITNTSGNPLQDRDAFIGDSAAWPDMEPLTLDLGMQFAGKAIKIRFRIGTDAGVGFYGWDIDDLVFKGITNTPFPVVDNDVTECEHPPVADAGADQTVPSNIGVLLDGSASSDPDNDLLTYKWEQTGGYLVLIINPTSPKPTFLSPTLKVDETLTFELTVDDGSATATDKVDIIVQAPVEPGTGGAGGGTGGAGGSTTTGGGGGGGSGGEGGATSTSSSSSGSSSSSSSGSETSTTGGATIPTGGCDCTVTGSANSSDGHGTDGALGAGLLGAAMLFLRKRRISIRRS